VYHSDRENGGDNPESELVRYMTGSSNLKHQACFIIGDTTCTPRFPQLRSIMTAHIAAVPVAVPWALTSYGQIIQVRRADVIVP
jgi:hypothetical protein